MSQRRSTPALARGPLVADLEPDAPTSAPEVVVLAHVAARPSFDCAKCGQPWPCAPARGELTEQYQADVVGLGCYLGAHLVDAMEHASRDRGWGRVDNLYDRFLGWIPRNRGNRRAA